MNQSSELNENITYQGGSDAQNNRMDQFKEVMGKVLDKAIETSKTVDFSSIM